MVVLHAISTTSGLNQIVQVKGLERVEGFGELKQKLSDAGVTVVLEVPTVHKWVPSYKECIVWRLQVPLLTWEVPTHIILACGTVIKFHSDNHHRITGTSHVGKGTCTSKQYAPY